MKHVEEPTENGRAWLEYLRMISLDRDPAPTLRHVQVLRGVCEARRS